MIKEERKRQKRNDSIWKAVRLVGALLVGISIIYIVISLTREKHAENVNEAILEDSIEMPTEEEAVTTETEGHEWNEVPQVDFESLWESNVDICAWIYIPETQVNYPVLRNNDAEDLYDDYYLMHTVDNKEGLPGAIYMEPCNMPDFTDANTVLYGHHMKNGSMFATLDLYMDAEFLEANPYVYVVTPQKNMVYQVYGAIIYDDRHLMRSFRFAEKESYQEFLTSLIENQNSKDVFNTDMEVSTQDRLLTMSTCVKNQDNNRLLVIAVLVDEYER